MNVLASKLQGNKPENFTAREQFRQLEYDQQRAYSLQHILEKKMAELGVIVCNSSIRENSSLESLYGLLT